MGIITDYFAGNPSGNLSREFGKSQMYNLVLCPIQAQLLDCSRGTRSLSRSSQGHIPFSVDEWLFSSKRKKPLAHISNQPTTNFSPRPEMKNRLKHGLRQLCRSPSHILLYLSFTALTRCARSSLAALARPPPLPAV